MKENKDTKRANREIVATLGSKHRLPIAFIRWIQNSDPLTAYCADRADDTFFSGLKRSCDGRGLPATQVDLLHRFWMDQPSHQRLDRENEERLLEQLSTSMDDIDWSKWVQGNPPLGDSVFEWVTYVLRRMNYPLYSRISSEAQTRLADRAATNRVSTGESIANAGIPDSALYVASGLPPDIELPFAAFHRMRNDLQSFMTQFDGTQPQVETVSRILLFLDVGDTEDALKEAAELERSLPDFGLLVTFIATRSNQATRPRILDLLLPEDIPLSITKGIRMLRKSTGRIGGEVSDFSFGPETIDGLWQSLVELASTSPNVKAQVTAAVTKACIHDALGWENDWVLPFEVPNQIVELVADWLKTDRDALAAACEVASGARLMSVGVPEGFEGIPRSILSALPTLPPDLRRLTRIVLVTLLDARSDFAGWVDAEEIAALLDGTRDMRDNLLEAFRREVLESGPSDIDSPILYGAVAYAFAIAQSQRSRGEAEDLFGQFSKQPELLPVIELAEALVPTISPSPALLDAISKLLELPEAVGAISINRGIAALAFAALKSGHVNSASMSIPALPMEMHIAVEMAKGLTLESAVVELIGPEHIRNTEDLQRASELVGFVAENDLGVGVLTRWFEAFPEGYGETDRYLFTMFGLSDRVVRAKTPNWETRQPPFRFVSLAIGKQQYVADAVTSVIASVAASRIGGSKLFGDVRIRDFGSPEIFRDMTLLAVICHAADSSAGDLRGLPVSQDMITRCATTAIHALRVGLTGATSKKEEMRYLCETSVYAIDVLRYIGNAHKALRPLLLAFRNLTSPGVDEKLFVSTAGPAVALELSSRLAGACHILFTARRDDRQWVSMRAEMVDHLISQLGIRKEAVESRPIDGWDPIAVEPHPIWRAAYARALGDLEANPGGRAYRQLASLAGKDPSQEVRAAADEALAKIGPVRESFSSGSHKRTVLNAWWELRQAHRLFLGCKVDEDAANLLRLREVRA